MSSTYTYTYTVSCIAVSFVCAAEASHFHALSDFILPLCSKKLITPCCLNYYFMNYEKAAHGLIADRSLRIGECVLRVLLALVSIFSILVLSHFFQADLHKARCSLSPNCRIGSNKCTECPRMRSGQQAESREQRPEHMCQSTQYSARMRGPRARARAFRFHIVRGSISPTELRPLYTWSSVSLPVALALAEGTSGSRLPPGLPPGGRKRRV